MKKKLTKALVLGAMLSLTMQSVSALAVTEPNIVNDDPMIVVSLGDSYSSGEGIETFYGQEKSLANKVYDQDWIAHRSTKGWPALIQVPGVSGTMSNYKTNSSSSASCQWYFAAASGAVTSNVTTTKQSKYINKRQGNIFKHTDYKYTAYLPKQLDVFNNINGGVDYVTMTIGGNDVGFADIITECATGSTYLGTSNLNKKLNKIWDNMDNTKADIKNVYEQVESKAGYDAAIVVAGYPKLLDKEGKGWLISEEEATTVNANVVLFNDVIEGLVNECADEGMNIYFVDVEDAFDNHEAYSDDAWINKIIFGAKSEDLDRTTIASAYSMHPNATGAVAYANCVNSKIAEIENNK